VTARKNPISSANVQTPPDTLFEISSQPSFHKAALSSEHVKRDGQPGKLTFGREEHYLPPSAGLGYTEVFQTGDLVPNVGHRESSAQADTYIVDALSLEANFDRSSIPICQRPYGSPIFMYVLGETFVAYIIFLYAAKAAYGITIPMGSAFFM